ncbi:hypothetical protein Aperf_G00000082713 [Anoplocephala perfoliata]
MPCSLGRYNHHSGIYRLREHFAVAFFGQSFYSLPLLATTLYVRWFLYPFILMVFGYPIVDILSRCVFLITLIYTIYWIYDIDTPSRGGRPRSWLRSLSVWKWVSQYFPIRLIVSEELLDWSKENCQENNIDGESIQLPRSSNYLLGYHPHGSCAAGALITCGTEALNFSKVFPGIKPHVASTDAYHNTPFIRDYAMSFVGRPIECKRIRNPTVEEVDRLREEYKQQLAQLFNKYRRLYDPSAEDIQFI